MKNAANGNPLGYFKIPRPLEAINKDGEIVPILLTVTDIQDKVGNVIGFVAVFIDNSVQKKLEYQVRHHPLTELPNSVYMNEKLDGHLNNVSERKKVSLLICLDIDHFKVVNAALGPKSGDDCLKEFSKFIGSCIRSTKTDERKLENLDILGHPQADEFILLLKNVDSEESINPLLNRLLNKLKTFRYSNGDFSLDLTVSMGCLVIKPGEKISPEDALSMTGVACDQAKEGGRNRFEIYSHDSKQREKIIEDLNWLKKIEKAFEEDRFRLYFQPITDIRGTEKNFSEKLNGEILIRMLDEDGTVIPPVFLSAAEKYGKIPKIDHWVIKESLKWLEANQENVEKISINISCISLSEGESFLNFVYDSVKDASIPGNKICFEITETAVVKHHSFLRKFIKNLKSLGCKFSIDDFGAGNAGLGYLSLPFDYIKIDGDFIKVLGSPDDSLLNTALIEAVKTFSERMGIQTIAEFVADENILKQVKKLGINWAQGYHFGKPEPLNSL